MTIQRELQNYPDSVSTITGVAQSKGLDPLTALASAIVESGLNPFAIGDHGTSFGLFQLHQGGELGNLSPSQAFDANTNANVALSTMAQVQASHPDWTPGQIAAGAQRPADPYGYASKVNDVYSQLQSLMHGGSSGSWSEKPSSGGNLWDPRDPNTIWNPKNLWMLDPRQPANYLPALKGPVFDSKQWAPLFVGVIVVLVGLAFLISDNKDVIAAAAK